MEWVSLCVPIREEHTLQHGLQHGHLPAPSMTVQHQRMKAYEFHGSAWNLKPGPWCRFWVGGCCHPEASSFSKWKIPLYQRVDAMRIQKKASFLKALNGSSLREILQNPTEAGLKNILLCSIRKITYLPCFFLPSLSGEVLGHYKGFEIIPYTLE